MRGRWLGLKQKVPSPALPLQTQAASSQDEGPYPAALAEVTKEQPSASWAHLCTLNNWTPIWAPEDGGLGGPAGHSGKARSARPAAGPRPGWQHHIVHRLANRQIFTNQIPPHMPRPFLSNCSGICFS